MLEILKSTRHSKITGNFAEHLVLYWLSKHGFECANVDHTGIDIIASNQSYASEVMGISVKRRSRNTGKEGTYLSVPNKNFEKFETARKAFCYKPYFAFVVDEANRDKCLHSYNGISA
jgi:Holliday junction resolvase-like predicted endonuclease